jgi:hypothetical protein
MKIGIVTDSTCDLPRYLIEQHELEVIPAFSSWKERNTRTGSASRAKISTGDCLASNPADNCRALDRRFLLPVRLPPHARL